jgi:23S rRNA pseudouridine1911/1915/1917 synthase
MISGPRRARRLRFEVAAGEEELRLDQLLARRIPELSRGDARALLALGGVFVDRRRTKIASRKLRTGQAVEVWIGGALERARQAGTARALPEASGTRSGRAPGEVAPAIVYRDEHLVVVDKPPGMLTAPTPEGDRGTLADVLARDPRLGGPIHVVHRLDLMTSGLLVLARTPLANRVLSERFRVHDVDREYLAAVGGRPAGLPRTLASPIAGRRAVTHVAVEDAAPGDRASLLRARLGTGRTHQIRIHLAGIGHPVLGDRDYGIPTAVDPPRLALHAAVLGFAHPATGVVLRFERPWPDDLARWWAGVAGRGG